METPNNQVQSSPEGSPVDPTDRMRKERKRRIGPFTVEVRLGQGGMGTVYLCRDPALARLVAVKVLREELLAHRESRDQFLAEARSIAQVQSPHVVQIYQVEPGEKPFFAMEYVEGSSVAERLRGAVKLPVREACSIILQAAEGLRALHTAEIVHRDITPSNILVDREGRAKIVDFGLASEAAAPCRREALEGTVAYMAPEQVRGGTIDQRTDLYGLGATFYHMLAGIPPYGPGTPQRMLARKSAGETAPPIRTLRPDVPKAVAVVVDRLLEVEPEKRYRSAAEVIAALKGARRRAEIRTAAAAACVLMAVLMALLVLFHRPADPLGPLTSFEREDGTLWIDFATLNEKAVRLGHVLKPELIGDELSPPPAVDLKQGLVLRDQVYHLVFPPFRISRVRLADLRFARMARAHLCFGVSHPTEWYRSVSFSLRSRQEGFTVRVVSRGVVVEEERWPWGRELWGAWTSGFTTELRFETGSPDVLRLSVYRSSDGQLLGSGAVALPAGSAWNRAVVRLKVAPYPHAGYTCFLRGIEIAGQAIPEATGAWVRGSTAWRSL